MDKTNSSNVSFKLGDHVTYRKNGVCEIVDIIEQNFVGQGKKEYYVLRSVYDSNTKVFVPIGSALEKEMQYVLTEDEINKIIEESKTVDCRWIEDCKARAAYFEEIVNSGDKAKILWIIKTVSEYKLEFEKTKKKMKANDLKYLAQAESIIAADFAFPLNTSKGGVASYIEEYLSK